MPVNNTRSITIQMSPRRGTSFGQEVDLGLKSPESFVVSPVRLGRYQDYNPTRIKFQDEAIDIVENQLYSETCPPTEIIGDDGSLGLETG